MIPSELTDAMKKEAIMLGYSDEEYSKYIREALIELATAIKNNPPREAEVERARDAFAKWGSYGWAPFGDLPEYEDSVPDSIEQADELAVAFFNDAYMADVFRELSDGYVKQKGEELKRLYEEEQYEYGVFLGFAYIDHEIIKRGVAAKSQHRKYGGIGFKRILERIEQNSGYKGSAWIINLQAVLEEFFKNGDDFQREFKVINRNFIMHGMNNRKPDKTDYIKVVLCYFSLVQFFKVIGDAL